MTRLRRWLRWQWDGRPRDDCGEPYPCAHRAYSRRVNHPKASA